MFVIMCCRLNGGAHGLANPGPQELPDLPGGLGGLGGAEQDLVDVRQALADLQADIDPGFGQRGAPSSVGGAWLALAFRRSLRASIESCMAWLGMSASPLA
jgi:hypothetical protein